MSAAGHWAIWKRKLEVASSGSSLRRNSSTCSGRTRRSIRVRGAQRQHRRSRSGSGNLRSARPRRPWRGLRGRPPCSGLWDNASCTGNAVVRRSSCCACRQTCTCLISFRKFTCGAKFSPQQKRTSAGKSADTTVPSAVHLLDLCRHKSTRLNSTLLNATEYNYKKRGGYRKSTWRFLHNLGSRSRPVGLRDNRIFSFPTKGPWLQVHAEPVGN
jgi:hypothetical protein